MEGAGAAVQECPEKGCDLVRFHILYAIGCVTKYSYWAGCLVNFGNIAIVFGLEFGKAQLRLADDWKRKWLSMGLKCPWGLIAKGSSIMF